MAPTPFPYLNTRRKFLFGLLFFLVLFALSATGEEWIGWATFAAVLVVVIIVDSAFFVENSFIMDPSYANWARKTTPTF